MNKNAESLKELEKKSKKLEKNIEKIKIPKKIDQEDYLKMIKVISKLEK